MPVFCLVFNCSNKKSKRKDLTFCRVPKIIKNQGEETEILSTERRRRWLTAISRDDLTDKILEYDRVCGEHFHSGKAAPLWDKWNVDWVPSLKLGHEKLKVSEASVQHSQERARRASERRKRMVETDAEINVVEKQPKRNEPGLTVQSLPFDVEMEDIEDIHENLPDHLKNAASQTELSCNSILPPEPSHQNMRFSDFDEALFSGDDDKVKFYTGLLSFEILQKVISFVVPSFPSF